MSKFKIVDLFSGTGGFSKGFEMTGDFEVIAGLDISPESAATFLVNHTNASIINDDIMKAPRRVL